MRAAVHDGERRAALDGQDAQLRAGLGMFLGAMVVFCFVLHDFDHVKSVLPGLRYLDFSCVETMNPVRGTYGAMLVYFLLGYALHRRTDAVRRLPAALPVVMIVGGSAALFVEWLVMTKKTGALYDIVYYGYNCLPTMCMAAGVFMLAQRMEGRLPAWSKRLCSLVGRNTLAIYYLHWIFGLVFLRDAALPGSLWLNLAKAAVMVLLGTCVGEIMRRTPLLRHLV